MTPVFETELNNPLILLVTEMMTPVPVTLSWSYKYDTGEQENCPLIFYSHRVRTVVTANRKLI